MSLKNYCLLIDEVCALALLPDPASLYEMANISVRDTDFSLIYQDNSAGGEVLIYAAFGPLPKQQRELALERLLETNLYLFRGSNSQALTYNAETGQVVMVSVLQMTDLDGDRLLGLLGHIADMAKEWQSTHFLDQAVSAPVANERSRQARPAGLDTGAQR